MARGQKMQGVRFPKHLSSAQAETLTVKYENTEFRKNDQNCGKEEKGDKIIVRT